MIRKTVIKAMKLRRIKSKKIAEYIGVTPSTYSLFLNGKISLGMTKIEALFGVLDITLHIRELPESHPDPQNDRK